MYSKMSWLILCWFLLNAGALVRAQSDNSQIIDAQNITRLAQFIAIDFDALPPEAGEILNGRVFVSPDGNLLAVVNSSGQVVILDDTGELLDVTEAILTEDAFPATFIDGAFDLTGQIIVALHTTGSGYHVTLHTVQGDTQTRWMESHDSPTAIWLDADAVWLEVIPSTPNHDPYIVRLAIDGPLADASLTMLPFVPAQDDAAVARIGRLPLPYAVTSTEGGLVSRWDLSAASLTATATVNDVPIYGALTPDGRWLAWRDPASEALHLLDFETGKDRTVVPLNGMYSPFLLLSMKADVIIGAGVNDEPIVVGWDTRNGKFHELGLYRQCRRLPDMVVLSGDGRALVIGCDQGLEIWRVNN